MEKVIQIDGKDVKFRATAALPRMYRIKFGRDMMKDMVRLGKAYEGSKEKEDEFEIMDLELFENVAYIMAKHADKDVPTDPSEWLEGFSLFSIYEVLPQLIELWEINTQTTVKPKKK